MTANELATELKTSTTALSQAIIRARSKSQVSGVWQIGDVLQEHIDYLRMKYQDKISKVARVGKGVTSPIETGNGDIVTPLSKSTVNDVLTPSGDTTYNKVYLLAFCISLVVINGLVIMPSLLDDKWYEVAKGGILCLLAPYIEYQYSGILLEIRKKDITVVQGIVRVFYQEKFAIAVLLPAMIFQATHVFILVCDVMKPTFIDYLFPGLIAFSYQVYGLMQTVHLPQIQATRQNKQN